MKPRELVSPRGDVKPRVLVSAPYAMPVIEEYKARLEAAGCEVIVARVQERLEEAEILPLVRDIDGIICGDDRITARVLEAAKRLKVIAKWGTGIDSIDMEAAKARGIAVRNTPNAFSEAVADTALGYMLLLARQLSRMDRDIRSGQWIKPQLHTLGEKTLGIIGVGNCGKAVARRAQAFGMRLLGNDIVDIPRDFLRSTGMRVAGLAELLAESDFVTLHTDLNPGSRHLIHGSTLRLMKPSACLINTSRGPVVDEAALARALKEGRIAWAALDVFEEEPLPPHSPLRSLENCWLAPHNANSSPRAARRVHENTIANVLAELKSHVEPLSSRAPAAGDSTTEDSMSPGLEQGT